MQGTSSPENVSTKLQRIAELAKEAPDMVFTTLAHHIDLELLHQAFRLTRKDGATGIDGQTATEYAAKLQENLRALLDRFKSGTYQAPPVRRVHIPKGDGKSTRPIGIPTFEDKVLQRAVTMVLEAVYEQDFLDCSYGFRPSRSAHQALETLWRGLMDTGGGWVIEVDIKSYFDTINHEKLMRMVGQRVNDRRMLKLIRRWLEAGVMTEHGYEGSEMGSPQGGVISPLLSNIYLHYLDICWDKLGRHLGTIVRYADDMVVICRTRKDAVHALKLIQEAMKRLELTLHPEKTKLVSLWEGKDGFDFLGMHHRSIPTETSQAQRYYTLHQFPSKKAMKKMRDRIKEVLGKRNVLWKETESLVAELNPILRGWRNYYGLKTASRWLATVDWYVLNRFTRWYNKKRKKKRHLAEMGKVWILLNDLKLVKLAA